MADSANLCYLLVLAVAIAFVIYGFMLLLEKQRSSENDVQVIQRQLRGVAFLILSQVILVLGLSLCLGTLGGGMDSLRRTVMAARV
jgi:uncharacterized membrane protein